MGLNRVCSWLARTMLHTHGLRRMFCVSAFFFICLPATFRPGLRTSITSLSQVGRKLHQSFKLYQQYSSLQCSIKNGNFLDP